MSCVSIGWGEGEGEENEREREKETHNSMIWQRRLSLGFQQEAEDLQLNINGDDGHALDKSRRRMKW